MPRPSRSNARLPSIAAPIAARDHHAERERLFSAAVESSNDAIITHVARRHDHRLEFGRRTPVRIHRGGGGRARTSRCIVPADRLPEVQDTLRRIGWGESIEHNETVRLRKDGRPVEVSLSISPIKAPSGATIGISKVARDITDSNSTRQALRQQTEERRRIFETSQDLILVTDSKGILVQISPSCESDPGLSAGGNDRPQRGRVHPSRRSRNCPRGNARRATRPNDAEFRFTRYIHKDGRAGDAVLDGRMVRAGQAAFLRRPRHDREPAGAGNLARERTAGARHHRYRARRLRPDGRTRHRSSDWNSQAEKIFGWTRAEAVGTKLSELIVPDVHRDAHQAGIERFLRTGEGADPRPPHRDRRAAARRQGDQGRTERHRAADAATASCSTDSSATSPTRSRPRTGSGRPRRWKPSASSPAASPMTSTIS